MLEPCPSCGVTIAPDRGTHCSQCHCPLPAPQTPSSLSQQHAQDSREPITSFDSAAVEQRIINWTVEKKWKIAKVVFWWVFVGVFLINLVATSGRDLDWWLIPYALFMAVMAGFLSILVTSAALNFLQQSDELHGYFVEDRDAIDLENLPRDLLSPTGSRNVQLPANSDQVTESNFGPEDSQLTRPATEDCEEATS